VQLAEPRHRGAGHAGPGDGDGGRIAVGQRRVLRVLDGRLLPVRGVLVLCLGGHFVLSLFGGNYTREGLFPLWMLALSYTPGLPKIFYVAVCRAQGKIARAAVVLTTFAVIELGAAAAGGVIDGLRGFSVAILLVTTVEGLATTPAIVRSAWSYGRHRRAVPAAGSP
jgi:hypothetical protein